MTYCWACARMVLTANENTTHAPASTQESPVPGSCAIPRWPVAATRSGEVGPAGGLPLAAACGLQPSKPAQVGYERGSLLRLRLPVKVHPIRRRNRRRGTRWRYSLHRLKEFDIVVH